MDDASELVTKLEQADVSEDDLELDAEDLDDEFIDALREVLEKASDRKKLRRLEKAAALEVGSDAQRTALQAIWMSLTDAQRKEMVECSSSEEEDDNSIDENADAQGVSALEAAAPRQLPPPARRSCPRGHVLTALNSKPADYAKLARKEGNCDVCDSDFRYVDGAYHCESCRNWDCCQACGSAVASDNPAKRRKKKG